MQKIYEIRSASQYRTQPSLSHNTISTATSDTDSDMKIDGHSISFEVDHLQLSKCVFDWADSYDQKDWNRLRGISAAQLKVDYREILGPDGYWPEMSLDDFVAKMSDPKFLGDPSLRTQHLIGATWWERISETEVIGHHQIRAAHLRFKDPSLTQEVKRGHSHATNELYYRKIDGTWKFAGLAPSVLFNEFDFKDIFQSHT